MDKKYIVLIIALLIFTYIAYAAGLPSKYNEAPLVGYTNTPDRTIRYKTVEQRTSSSSSGYYASGSSYSSSRSYSGGSYSYGK